MDRTQKQQIATALHDDLAETVCVVVTHQTGLTVDEVTQLRRQMRNAGARYRVTKNRLARRALEGTPFANLAPLFTGPTAIAFSRDPVAAATGSREKAIAVGPVNSGARSANGVPSIARRASRFLVTR